jgi:hypothetical protein
MHKINILFCYKFTELVNREQEINFLNTQK